jgi:hypothetical protein
LKLADVQQSNVHPIVEPDPKQMRRHVGHLFEGWLDGCHEGLVELAWTDGGDGRLRHAQLFGTDRLDELVQRALAENRKPGQNVYVGQALRNPEAPRSGRCKDDHFWALTAYYADIDDDVTATATVNYRHRGCPPTGVVVTGRHPHVRAQMLWRLQEPERDPNLCRQQNLALAEALGGDTSVVNSGRVLRLGGSIAWPVKAGRVIERTEFLSFDDGRPKVYLREQIARAFPPAQPTLSAQVVNGATAPNKPTPGSSAATSTAPSAPDSAAALQIGTSNLSVDACVARIRAGDRWHDNILRLVGHWIARGWSDAEILTAAEALTLPGYTVDQTRREVTAMIAGGRRKWGKPNPSIAIEEAERSPFVLRPIGVLDPCKRPPRDWLVRHRLMRKHTTVTAAAPGVGKSTLTIEEAVSLASARDFLGFGIDRTRKVAVINNEETRDELERRIEATCVHFDVPFTAIAETLYLHSGIDSEKLIVARRENDAVVVEPRARELARFLAGAGIDLLVIDPFVQIHRVSENQNEEIEQVMMALRAVSVEANCALHLVHHTRKPPAGSAHQAGDIFAVRGGGAIVGDAHFVFTLADMGAGDGDALGVKEEDRKKYIRLDDAKGKLAPPSGARWFERVGVTMPYGLIGEQVGVLVPHEFDEPQAIVTPSAATEILKDIDARWHEGNPLSAFPQSPRYVVPLMVQRHGMSPKSARRLLLDWISNGMVATEVYDTDAKSKGLKVLRWPG